MIQTYKIINNFDDTDVSNIFKFSSTTCTRNSIGKLCVNFSHTKIKMFSFSSIVPPVWNKLPELVKKAPNVNTFKNASDRQNVLVEIYFMILMNNTCVEVLKDLINQIIIMMGRYIGREA